ncbi:MAG: four helix bundle protein [Bacteroidales bacterium]|nr:four helix bundle protein [Bacteroidales bacterium]
MDTQQQERVVSFFRFEDLRVYGKATDYANWVIANLANAGSDAARVLIESFCRSAFDIALNIAEGSARNKSQFDHYLKISKTAIRECIVYTAVAVKEGLMNDEQGNQSREYLMELTRMIGALIISLQRGSRRRDDESYPSDYDDAPANDGFDPLDAISSDF